jgi:hypothetical protein
MATPIRVQMKRKNGQVVSPYDEYMGGNCSQGGWKL